MKQSRQLPLIAVLLCSACATPVNFRIPTARMDSPESEGKEVSFHGLIGYRTSQEVSLTPDSSTVPINGNRPDTSVLGGWGYGFGVGFLDRFDFDFKRTFDAPTLYQVKFQFLGDTMANANSGNFSLAATAGYGNTRDQGSSTEIFSTQTSSYDIGVKLWDFSLIAGYRNSPKNLFYSSLSMIRGTFDGSQKTFTAAAATPFSGTVSDYGFYLGTLFTPGRGVENAQSLGDRMFIQAEVGVNNLAAQGKKDFTPGGSIAVGAQF